MLLCRQPRSPCFRSSGTTASTRFQLTRCQPRCCASPSRFSLRCLGPSQPTSASAWRPLREGAEGRHTCACSTMQGLFGGKQSTLLHSGTSWMSHSAVRRFSCISSLAALVAQTWKEKSILACKQSATSIIWTYAGLLVANASSGLPVLGPWASVLVCAGSSRPQHICT